MLNLSIIFFLIFILNQKVFIHILIGLNLNFFRDEYLRVLFLPIFYPSLLIKLKSILAFFVLLIFTLFFFIFLLILLFLFWLCFLFLFFVLFKIWVKLLLRQFQLFLHQFFTVLFLFNFLLSNFVEFFQFLISFLNVILTE